MPDIFNLGESFNIKGKLSNHYYEGILFDKSRKNPNTFNGKHYIVDIQESSVNEVISFYSIQTFENDIPFDTLQGEKYLIIDGKPRFGRYATIDDLKGL